MDTKNGKYSQENNLPQQIMLKREEDCCLGKTETTKKMKCKIKMKWGVLINFWTPFYLRSRRRCFSFIALDPAWLAHLMFWLRNVRNIWKLHSPWLLIMLNTHAFQSLLIRSKIRVAREYIMQRKGTGRLVYAVIATFCYRIHWGASEKKTSSIQ